jgi:hypothetical protein
MNNSHNTRQNVPPPGMDPRSPQFQGPFPGPGPMPMPQQRQNAPITQPSSLSGTFPPFIAQRMKGKNKRSIIIGSVLGLLILLGGIAFAAWCL